MARKPTRRQIHDLASAEAALQEARECFHTARYLDGLDLYEQLIEVFPSQSTELLAELWNHYQALPHKDNRYYLYVARYFDFDIKSTDKVLDIGSGHDPFPFSTHLADIAPDDDNYGRVGAPLKRDSSKPFTECSVEAMPFSDKEFDFIYCSHVLEHTTSPERACQELMRVGKRGYIETPTFGKDLWLNSAKISNHHWKVSVSKGVLCFDPYSEDEKNGIGSNIIMEMHCHPESAREKALAAIILLKSRQLNTMLYWEGEIKYEVRRG